MRITLLSTNPLVYSSNAYFIRGEMNSLQDKNTLIDTGGDSSYLDEIEAINTGFGKKKVEQIILTHNHFDHTGGIIGLKQKYDPVVYGYSRFSLVDELLRDGQQIQIGSKIGKILYAPYHSNDSICIYIEEEGILFSGDIQLQIYSDYENADKEFLEFIRFLIFLDIKAIYPGHGLPILENVPKILRNTITKLKFTN